LLSQELNTIEDLENPQLSSPSATSDEDTQTNQNGGLLAGARILVVEDEFVIAMQLQTVFEDEGAQVLGPYHSLSEALKHAETDDISAASLDVNLGRDTAAPVAGLLARRHIPFVFYSVQTNDPSLAPWRHIRVIQKPASPHELVQAMASLLHRQ
jgi:DNA-binding response OmpR family regulator